jgi:hypothetical protein
MRVRLVLCAVTLAVLQPGCSFVCYGARNLIEAPVDAIDRCILGKRAESMANAAWADVLKDEGGRRLHSYYYEDGFKCGFVDYIRYDGNGEPPAAPPWIYQTSGFETPTGHDAIEEWFAGFRHGAVVARSTGYREAAVVLPLSQPPLYSNDSQAGPERTGGQHSPTASDELPPPRAVPPPPAPPPGPGTPP